MGILSTMERGGIDPAPVIFVTESNRKLRDGRRRGIHQLISVFANSMRHSAVAFEVKSKYFYITSYLGYNFSGF